MLDEQKLDTHIGRGLAPGWKPYLAYMAKAANISSARGRAYM
jgi:hypothetical protein